MYKDAKDCGVFALANAFHFARGDDNIDLIILNSVK